MKHDSGARPRIRKLSKSIADVLGNAREVARRQSIRGAKPVILSVSGGAIVGAALAVAPTAPAWAQEESALEEITVTGSRIRRQDFTANAPITTIDESTFEETSTIGVESVLNQLPQFVPAVTQFTTFDIQNTATSTVGASTVSLRGLGANRNLVLIDGRRAMPVNPTMVVDTNSIPSAAIQRVEIISGGASAVYGADAVGGVVNFVLKDDFEGATVDIKFGDTQHGGNQEVTVSGLIGANVAGDRGNVMLGVERSSRTKQGLWERDWRVEDYANPTTNGTQIFPTETWISNPWGQFGFNLPDQNVVNDMFVNAPGSEALPCALGTNFFTGLPDPNISGDCPLTPSGAYLGVPNTAQFHFNRTPDGTGTVFTGINAGGTGAAGAFRYNGPYDVDNYGEFAGLPWRVIQPDGNIKENTFWQWASIPLERLSSFAKGEFEVSENIRVVGQALFTRTENQTSLGNTSDTIGVWGGGFPYGSELYTPSVTNLGPDGLPNTGDSLDFNGNGIPDIPGESFEDMTTLPAYTAGGLYQLDCPEMGGCTESQVWPLPSEVQTLLNSRSDPNADVWANRTQDFLRHQLGGARMSRNKTTTMQLSLGVEGELPSGNDFWDITVSTGRTDTTNLLGGSARLSTWRALLAAPNWGVAYVGDPNPADSGFAESVPTCTSGLPIARDFLVTDDCIEMLHAVLHNETLIEQSIFEANLVGDLAEMRAGPLQYALGATYRENSFEYAPDNLSQNGSLTDSPAGLFPNANSQGKFDVSEIYGELLIPIVSDGPAGVEHFTVELGGRVSDWSIEQVNQIQTYKALIDWAITPRYRLRGGFNRAHRAPNLGELFIARTQIWPGATSLYADQCSQNSTFGPFSANPGPAGAEQAAQTEAICRVLMGPTGAFEYYDNRPLSQQPTGEGFFGGSPGIQNSFGNPNLREEKADTFTLGVVMDFLENWTLTVDYYEIEIEDMIALEGPDTIYETCLSLEFNPEGDPFSDACVRIIRDPRDGNSSQVDRTFTNEGRAKVSGVDLQLNWSKMLANGGFNITTVANYNMGSETQDRANVTTYDWKGTLGCALQIQCQGYDYRLFTTFNYFRGPWNVTLRHQYWPSILDASYSEGSPADARDPLGNINDSYQLFYLGASYSFRDRYTLRFGIENLFDEEPPLVGGDPGANRFPITPSHATGSGVGGFGEGGSATYDALGRRGFVSLTMDF
jgi:iron complex outermembrane receptor protein